MFETPQFFFVRRKHGRAGYDDRCVWTVRLPSYVRSTEPHLQECEVFGEESSGLLYQPVVGGESGGGFLRRQEGPGSCLSIIAVIEGLPMIQRAPTREV